ncbi:MAG: prolipoprotein diacylglyceryl transferase [Sphingomonadaceae bacterium]
MILLLIADATAAIRYDQLGIGPVAYDFGFFKLRWYSLSYIAGIILAWWYLLKLIAAPGAPMARRHVDDFIFYATLGIILGGRLGYCLFYKPSIFATPLDIIRVWEGGMSLHGGLLGVIIALWLFTRAHKLSMLRVADYVACATPFGLLLGRVANFVNGELWGRPTDMPWGIIFPGTSDNVPRHPSQLYEAGLEGVLLFAILWWMFWKSAARYQPGKLVGTALVIYSVSRSAVELVRQPDAGLEDLPWGLTMGQTLSLPMFIIGIYLFVSAKARRTRVEAVAGERSVA